MSTALKVDLGGEIFAYDYGARVAYVTTFDQNSLK